MQPGQPQIQRCKCVLGAGWSCKAQCCQTQRSRDPQRPNQQAVGSGLLIGVQSMTEEERRKKKEVRTFKKLEIFKSRNWRFSIFHFLFLFSFLFFYRSSFERKRNLRVFGQPPGICCDGIMYACVVAKRGSELPKHTKSLHQRARTKEDGRGLASKDQERVGEGVKGK